MPPRLRKLIGLFAILAFLALYVIVFATLGDYIPGHWAAQLAYFAVAGTLWGVPLFPLIRWMERVPDA
jgi:hypothetical protein